MCGGRSDWSLTKLAMRFRRNQWLLWLLAAGAIAMVCWRVPIALAERALWLRLRASDPSAAELYEINSWLEVVWIALAVVCLVGCLLAARKPGHLR